MPWRTSCGRCTGWGGGTQALSPGAGVYSHHLFAAVQSVELIQSTASRGCRVTWLFTRYFQTVGDLAEHLEKKIVLTLLEALKIVCRD